MCEIQPELAGRDLMRFKNIECGYACYLETGEVEMSAYEPLTREELDLAFASTERTFRELQDHWQKLEAAVNPDRCVYVEAIPGIEAIRIGRTVDLPQRLRRFEYRYFPVEVILTGECTAGEFVPEEAETELFSLLYPIHLSLHNPNLYATLPTKDWYLPDRHKILESFSRLCRGGLLTRYYRRALFEDLTRLYPRDEDAV